MTDPKTYTVWVECTRTETFIAPVKIDAEEFRDWNGGDGVTVDALVEFLEAGPQIDLDAAVEGQWSTSEEFEIVGAAVGKDFEVSA